MIRMNSTGWQWCRPWYCCPFLHVQYLWQAAGNACDTQTNPHHLLFSARGTCASTCSQPLIRICTVGLAACRCVVCGTMGKKNTSEETQAYSSTSWWGKTVQWNKNANRLCENCRNVVGKALLLGEAHQELSPLFIFPTMPWYFLPNLVVLLIHCVFLRQEVEE